MRMLVFAWLFIPSLTMAQKLEKNGIDEFKKVMVKETSQEQITGTSTAINAIVRARKVGDSSTVFEFKFIHYGEAMAISEGAELMMKTKGDSVITIRCIQPAISCVGCGSKGLLGSGNLGIAAFYSIEPNQSEYLKTHPVVKIRFYEVDGYLEFDVKEKYQAVIMNELKLMDE